MRNTSRRIPPDAFNPLPTPDHRHRDSDASFASSRPSSVGIGRPSTAAFSDRHHQSSAVRTINSFLSSHSSHLSLRSHPISSAKDITEVLNFLLHLLDFNVSKLEDDLLVVVKLLNCPFKVNKSTLRAPNTPHNWPSFLGLIHWLVQIVMYKEHLVANSRSFVENDSMFEYAKESYVVFIRGDDDAVEELDGEFRRKLEAERDNVLENVKVLEGNFNEVAARVEGLRTGLTEKEKLEKGRSALENDLGKFQAMVVQWNQANENMEKTIEEKKGELEKKVEERKRIEEENEELKQRVEVQSFNARDAERMKRELQAVERDIGEAEAARNGWEEKMWDLDATIGHKFKELEALTIESNLAARRLKLGNEFQLLLNAKGSTPAEIMGVDYKSNLKPGLQSFGDEIKRSSVEKLDELILLQQQSSELTAKIEGKRNRLSALQYHIEEMDDQLNQLRREIEGFIARCAAEAKKLTEDVQNEAYNLDSLENEAAALLKEAEVKHQDAVTQCEEEIQRQARELFVLVDSVSKYKEHVESKVSEMKSKTSETISVITHDYKRSVPAQFGSAFKAI